MIGRTTTSDHAGESQELRACVGVAAAKAQRAAHALRAEPDHEHAEEQQRIRVPVPGERFPGDERVDAVAVPVKDVEAMHAEREDRGEAVEHRDGDDGEPPTAQASPPLVDEAPEQRDEE